MTWTKEAREKWSKEHPEAFSNEARRANYQKYKKRILAWRKKWYVANRQKSKEIHAKWYLKNKDKNHKYYIEKNRKFYKDLRDKIFEKLGNECVKCKFSDPRALQIDHINGGGTKELKSFSTTRKYYLNILEDKENRFQILCANCNSIKRFENKEIKRKYD